MELVQQVVVPEIARQDTRPQIGQCGFEVMRALNHSMVGTLKMSQLKSKDVPYPCHKAKAYTAARLASLCRALALTHRQHGEGTL